MKVNVRELTFEDRRAIWEWGQNPSVSSLTKLSHKDGSLDYERHCRWFDRIISSENSVWLVASIQALRCGIVRFDQEEESVYGMKLMLKTAYYGQGLVTPLLEEAISYFKGKVSVKKIYHRPGFSNESSFRPFELAGFKRTLHSGPVYEMEIS